MAFHSPKQLLEPGKPGNNWRSSKYYCSIIPIFMENIERLKH